MNTKFLTPRVGAVAGIVGTLTFSTMWVLAVLADGGWVLGQMTLSELGDRSRGGAVFFNTACIVTGALSIVFAGGLNRALSRGLLAQAGTILLGVASLFLIGVGVFPIDTGLPHTVFSYAFFTTAAMALALLIVPLWRSHVFHRWGGMFTALILIIDLVSILFLPLAGSEALAVGGLLLWGFLISARMLAHHPLV